MFPRGVLVMLLAAVIFAVMSAMARGLPGLSCYAITGVRFVVGGLAMMAVFSLGIREMRWTNWPWIIARGISGGMAVMMYFWAISHVGLSKAVLYNCTSVIFSALFAVPFLREHITARHWATVAVALAGIALVTGVQDLSVSMTDLTALSCGLFSGFAYVCITKCRKTDSSTNIFWSQCLFGLAIVGWPAFRTWGAPSAVQWMMLLGIALFATAGQLAMTYAYKFTGAAYGSLLGLLTPVIGTAIGILYFKESPSAGFFVGAALILVACGYLSFNPVSRAVREVSDAER